MICDKCKYKVPILVEVIINRTRTETSETTTTEEWCIFCIIGHRG